MPIFLLSVAMIILFIIFLFTLAEGEGAIALLFFMCFALLGGWTACSSSQPLKIYKTLEVISQDVNGSSAISYENYFGDLVIVNLNSKLEKNIQSGSNVRITIFNRFYAGVYYLPEDKFEVLTPGK